MSFARRFFDAVVERPPFYVTMSPWLNFHRVWHVIDRRSNTGVTNFNSAEEAKTFAAERNAEWDAARRLAK